MEPKSKNLVTVRAEGAWSLGTPASTLNHGRGIRIGLPDSGVFTTHVSLSNATIDPLGPWDAKHFVRTTSEDQGRRKTQSAHGTGVASVIVGIAPAAEIVPVRVGKYPLQLADSALTAAVNYLRRPTEGEWRECHVISFSFGGKWLFGLREALQAAIAEGKIVVAAAGNGGQFWPASLIMRRVVSQPGAYPEVICVAATDTERNPWSGSCIGPEVDVAAPGAGFCVASGPTIEMAPAGGTSYAVAHVAGAAALWLAYHGRDQLIDRYGRHQLQAVFRYVLRASASRPKPWPAGLGTGVLDAEALLRRPLPEAAELERERFPADTRRRVFRYASAAFRPVRMVTRSRPRHMLVGGLYDPGARGRPRTALQKHADFFDLNHDGVITIRETRTALKRLKLRQPTLAAIGLCALVGPRTWRAPLAFTINTDDIHLAEHFGSSQAFGIDGQFDEGKLKDVFTQFGGRRGGLEQQDIANFMADAMERDRRSGALPSSRVLGAPVRWFHRKMSSLEFPLLQERLSVRQEASGSIAQGALTPISEKDLEAFFKGDLLDELTDPRNLPGLRSSRPSERGEGSDR